MIRVLYVDINDNNYTPWIDSIKHKLKSIASIDTIFVYANNRDDCSYESKVKEAVQETTGIAFFHASNCAATDIVREIPNSYALVLFTGGGLSDDEKNNFKGYSAKYFIEGIDHNRSCPWFLKDFFVDWVERGGPEKTNPNFEILEKGSRQVAINMLHKLREVVLTPLVALDLLLQSDMASEEIKKGFTDSEGKKVELNEHIKRSGKTLRKILDEDSPTAVRLSEFGEDDLERIKKRIDNGSKNILGSLINEIEKLNAMPDLIRNEIKKDFLG